MAFLARVIAACVTMSIGVAASWVRDGTLDGLVQTEPPKPTEVAYGREAVAHMHFEMKLPAFHMLDERRFGYSLSSGASSVHLDELVLKLADSPWTAQDVADYATQIELGVDVKREAVGPRQADGSYTFTATRDGKKLVGWQAAKDCGEYQIAAVVLTTSRVELAQIEKAFYAGHCTKELKGHDSDDMVRALEAEKLMPPPPGM